MFLIVIKVDIRETEFKGVPTRDIETEEIWTKEFPLDTDGGNVDTNVSIGGLIYKA